MHDDFPSVGCRHGFSPNMSSFPAKTSKTMWVMVMPKGLYAAVLQPMEWTFRTNVDKRCADTTFVHKPNGQCHLEGLCIGRSIILKSLFKIEKNEMGGACGVYGGGERCAQGSGGET